MSESLDSQKPGKGAIRHFSDFIVWQKAREVGGGVFELSKTFPADERFSLTDQIRRSSRSIGANIAEAWGKRYYQAAFVAKLVDSDGEAHETEHRLLESESCGYLAHSEIAPLGEKLREVGKMLGSMINRPEPFITNRERSSAAEF
jgi:four helix bundle protein